jgi:PAS domain S-box-containing protein
MKPEEVVRGRVEDRLRFQARLLDAVGEAVVATDVEGRIIYWNAAAEALYGWTAEEALGQNVVDIMPTADSREESLRILEGVLRGKAWSGECQVRDRHGREFPALVNTSPIMDEAGRPAGLIGTSADISERKREEEGQRFLAQAGQVLASSLDYATTLRSVATLAVPHLGDWCLVHVREADDLPVVPVARVVPPAESAAADRLESLLTGPTGALAELVAGAALVHAPTEGGPESLRADQLHAIGVRSVLVVPLRARDAIVGTMTFAVTGEDHGFDEGDRDLARELGRRAGVAIDNARLYRDAQEGNRAKADFLAVVSHELRTPLNAIAGYADLLAGGISGPLNDSQQRHVERIKVGAGHLAQLIDEVLTFARVESGRESLTVLPVDVGEIARDAADTLADDARHKGLSLTVDLPDSPMILRTDPRKVRQILVNLLGNAVKYTDHGQVFLRLRPADQGAEFQVRDTGIGIEPDATERIFEPFWQAESPNTRTVGGTGLGLSVSRRLAELVGGTLDVESQVGSGSTFTLRVPDRADAGEVAVQPAAT